jgi:collagenase-like PrtC family protease
VCLWLRAKEETLWLAKLARSLHEATADGSSKVYLGHDHETKKRHYHNRTIRGRMWELQATYEEVART